MAVRCLLLVFMLAYCCMLLQTAFLGQYHKPTANHVVTSKSLPATGHLLNINMDWPGPRRPGNQFTGSKSRPGLVLTFVPGTYVVETLKS